MQVHYNLKDNTHRSASKTFSTVIWDNYIYVYINVYTVKHACNEIIFVLECQNGNSCTTYGLLTWNNSSMARAPIMKS